MLYLKIELQSFSRSAEPVLAKKLPRSFAHIFLLQGPPASSIFEHMTPQAHETSSTYETLQKLKFLLVFLY